MTDDDDVGQGGPMIRWDLIDHAAHAWANLPARDHAATVVAGAPWDLTEPEWVALRLRIRGDNELDR